MDSGTTARRWPWLPWLAAVVALAAGTWLAVALAGAATRPFIGSDIPCRAGGCRASVDYEPDPGHAAEIEVDWDHRGPPATAFHADAREHCADLEPDSDTAGSVTEPPDTTPTDTFPTETFPTDTNPLDRAIPPQDAGLPIDCEATSPAYKTAGTFDVVVRLAVDSGAPHYTTHAVRVGSAHAATIGGSSSGNGCGVVPAGVECGPGNGRKTAGGSGLGKVSHRGWPAVTGILWIDQSTHGYTARGTARNDELLGHGGSDKLVGGAGNDILWGDWDPTGNDTTQHDTLVGGAGNDWLYTSHGLNTVLGGPGSDHVWAYYGHGTIDCGPGNDFAKISLTAHYTARHCEHISHFCAFGANPAGGCYKPGENPADRRR